MNKTDLQIIQKSNIFTDAYQNNVLSNELIIEIYNYTTSKLQMIEIFPWLKNIIPKCVYCNKQSHFFVKFEYDDSCNNCKKHNNISDNKYICNLNCKSLYYDIEYGDYIINPSQENNYIIQAELLCEKDDCFYCGRRVMYNVIANGYQLQKLPSKPKNKIQQNVELFIKNKLVLDENSKIEIPNVIYLYKQFFNINKNLSNKEQNKEIQNEFRKNFQTQKNYFIGCKFA
jgi:hypothetical protein